MHRSATVSSTPNNILKRYIISLFFTILIVNIKFTFSYTIHQNEEAVILKAVYIPEERVTYEGAQVWRVIANEDQEEFVDYLQETGGKIHYFDLFPFSITYTDQNFFFKNRSFTMGWKRYSNRRSSSSRSYTKSNKIS